VHPGDLAGGFSDFEMTWLLYCRWRCHCFYESNDVKWPNQQCQSTEGRY